MQGSAHRRSGRSLKYRRSPDGAEGEDSVSETQSIPRSGGPSTPVKTTSSSVSKLPQSPRKLTKSSPSPKKSTKSEEGSPGLVRQGTFNLDQTEAFIDKSQMGDGGEGNALGDQGWQIDEDECINDTLSAHFNRLKQIQTLKQ